MRPVNETDRVQPHAAWAASGPLGHFASLWRQFWFAPADPIGMHAIRVMFGLMAVAWLISFFGHQRALLGIDGWADRQTYREIQDAMNFGDGPPVPLGWSLTFLATTPTATDGFYFASIIAAILFTVGIVPRITGVLVWLAIASFTENPATRYGGDVYLIVFSMYLAMGYVLFGLETDFAGRLGRLLGRRLPWFFGTSSFGRQSNVANASVAANFTMRLLQVHMAVMMTASGLHKLQISEWWSGTALWLPRPAFHTSLEEALAVPFAPRLWLIVLSLSACLIITWQVSFPFLMWQRRWRPTMILAAVMGCAAHAFLYRLPTFGPAVVVGCLTFIGAEQWRRAVGSVKAFPWLARWLTMSRMSRIDTGIPSESRSVA